MEVFMLVEKTLKRQAMFWEKVNIVDDEDSCWPWIGAVNENGYGFIDVTIYGKQKRFYAHRVSWEWDNNEDIPEKLIIRHKCDNPPCVRPSHLVLGTHLDNTNDKMERGRYVSAVAEIDAATAVEIRHKRASGMTAKELGVQYNLTPQHISNICTGVYWSDAGGPLTSRFLISDLMIYSVLSDSRLMTREAVAAKYNISRAAVYQIVSGIKLPKSPPTNEHHKSLLENIGNLKIDTDSKMLELA